MPREDRRIIFDSTDVYKAIFALCMQKDLKKPPPGAITSVTMKADEEQTFVVKIENVLGSTSVESEYSRDFMAAALMLYCRTLKIPLPKKATKSVDIGGDTIILRIMI